MTNSARYIGDVVFDALRKRPGFMEESRRLIAEDWRTGTASFRSYVGPLIGEVFHHPSNPEAWGDLTHQYIEFRVMEGYADYVREPWLWAYKNLVGALIDPHVVRTALDGIAHNKGKDRQ